MRYKLIIEVLHGKFEGKFMEQAFDADSDDKAIAFANACSELKTLGGCHVEFGSYAFYRRVLFFWSKISKNKTYRGDGSVNLTGGKSPC